MNTEAWKGAMTKIKGCTFHQVCHRGRISSSKGLYSFFIVRVTGRMTFGLRRCLRRALTLQIVFSWMTCLGGCPKIRTDRFCIYFSLNVIN